MVYVSIIIPIHGGKNNTIVCLRSLSHLSFSQSKMEIIVVDNASPDDSIITIQKSYPKIKILSSKTNEGFAKAVNKGIKKAVGNYIFVINNDIIFDKSFLNILIDYMEEHQDVGITGGKIYYLKPRNKLLFSGVSFNPWTGAIKQLSKPDIRKESEWIQGCAMLIKRKVIQKIGLFDPEYFFSFEDADFCLRARKSGFKVIYIPQAIARHKESGTIDKFGQRKKSLELYKAKFRYVFKNLSLLQIITITLIQFFLIAPIRIFSVRYPPFYLSSLFEGYFYNLLKIPRIIKSR